VKGFDVTLEELRAAKRDEILSIAARHGVESVRVFGSFARGDARDDSDLDLLIEAAGPRTPFFPGGLIADLEESLGRRVDVVEPSALHRLIRAEVLAEAVPL
jgi:predicted nucleotidyltransferase